VLLSSTRIGGTTVGRICILGHRTEHADVATAVSAIRRHAADVVGGDAAGSAAPRREASRRPPP
jgi:hypothetical protein